MNGKIDIHRYTSNREPREGWTIALTDEDTGIEIFKVELGMLEFSQAIGGLGRIPVTYETRGLEYIGKKREVKTENIYIPYMVAVKRDEQIKQIQNAVAVYEVDGWRARYEDAQNGNRIVRGLGDKNGAVYSVCFTRYI